MKIKKKRVAVTPRDAVFPLCVCVLALSAIFFWLLLLWFVTCV